MKTSSLTVLCLTAVALLLAGSARADAAEYAWFEGERPAEADIEVPPHAWDGGQLLSEGGWAGISIPADEVEERIPEGGATIAYDFSVGATGDYQVWGRIGMEYVRAPFDWRLDDGPWDRVTLWDAEDQTIDLMELGRWKSIGWLKMGRARLESGQHRLTIRIPVPYKEDEDGNKQPQRIIWTADAFCVYLGDFRPNGKHKPGADWQSERDREAAEKVFEMPPVESPRVETALHGLWQMGRFDETGLVTDREGPVPLPDHPLHWESMSVPGDRHAQLPDTVFNHRYFLRTRVRIPGGHAGRSFFLDVAELSCFATVYVNGRRVGHRTVPFAPWRLDVTDAVRPSGVNEIWIGVKDRYYALTGSRRHHGNPRYSFHTPLEYLRGNQGVTMRYDYPVRNTHANGLLDRLTLTSTGPVYASGVFVKPSVKDDRLAAEVTLSNSGEGARAVTVSAHVEPWNRGEGGEAALHLPSQRVEAPAGGGKTVELKRSDEDGLPLKLWWPDRPQLYQLVTTVRDGEKVLDVERTRFGYRDWDIRGTRFYLNGMPYQLRADLTGYGAAPGEGEALVKKWREYGQTMFRLRFQREWSGMTQRQVLGFMDEHGVPVRRTISTFDGQHASYGLTKRDDEGNKIPNKPLFDNWRRQIRARLLRERNHPCVFMWELDNEIIYINTRNFGNLDVVEPEFTRASEMILELDPTHDAVNVAGGRALMEQSLPVNGCHYEETDPRDYPDMAYGLEGWTETSPKQPWPMAMDKPIFLSETYFASGWSLGKLAKIGGESVFLGRGEARPAVALMARMFSEGYRWIGLGGFHYWFSDQTSGAGHYPSWQPVAVFSRQWNWTFGSADTIERTLKVFNDTRHETPITARWALVANERTIERGEKTFRIAPGKAQVWPVEVPLPEVEERTEAEFVLTAERDGAEVFRDVKEVSIILPDRAPAPNAAEGDVLLWDPNGAVADRLTRRGVPFARVSSLDDVEEAGEGWRLLIVGPDALSRRRATDQRWWSLAARGKRVLVLDQEYPLHYTAVPADFEVSDYVGRIAFMENVDHPIFRGLKQKDFRTWAEDHVVYRNAYRKASRGARSLMQCDQNLNYSAIAECPVQDGLMLLCQAVVGSKLRTDPVAQRLFDQMVNYALSYQLAQRPTAMVAKAGSEKFELLSGTGVNFERVDNPVQAIESGAYEIVVVDATARNMRRLAAAAGRVRRFAEAGNWVMVWGVTPETIDQFNELAGVQHLIRPFRVEKVQIPTPRDGLMAGLSQRDVVMSTGRRIQAGSSNEHPSGDGFTYVVDYRDVAPFADWPTPQEMGKPEGAGGNDHDPMNLVNGFDDKLNWRYAFTIIMERGDHTHWTIELPREEAITGFKLDPRRTFHHLRRIKLTFDGNPDSSIVLDVDDPDAPQEYDFEPRRAREVTFDLTAWDEVSDRDIIGLDNLWLYAERPRRFRRKVEPLLNIGTLVKYPMGRGGLILNQVKVMDSEPLPINAQKKKTIVSALLQNLGASFSGKRVLLPGEGLEYEPVSLEGYCNLYLTSEEGWPVGDRDLSHLPLDRQEFAGVVYNIRNFKTSPLESAIGLGRHRRFRGGNAVEGIEVNRTADALFFLHTMIEKRQWRPRRREDREPPVVLRYVVHYTDGETEEVPVRYNRGAADWRQEKPAGLKDAALAWSAPFPDAEDGERAAIYAMQWNNPRPEAEVRSIDVKLGEEGARYALPVVLGITTADVIE